MTDSTEDDPREPDQFDFDEPAPEASAADPYDDLGDAPQEGGIEAPVVVTERGPRRSLVGPLLKVGGGVLVVGAIAAGVYAVGPSLLGGGRPGSTPIQAAVITKELKSADGEARKKANDQLLKELLESPNLPSAADIGALKEIRAALSQQTDASTQATIQLIDQLLESVGAAPAVDASTSSWDGSDRQYLAPVVIPFPYALLVAAIGQQPDAEPPLPNKATNYLAWFAAQLDRAEQNLKQSNFEQALTHLRELETSGTPLNPRQQMLVEQKRRAVIEAMIKSLRAAIASGDEALVARLATVNQEVATIRDVQVPALDTKVTKLRTDTDTLTTSVQGLETSVTDLGTNLADVGKVVGETSKKITTLETDSKTLMADLKDVKTGITTVSTSLASIQMRSDALDAAVRKSIASLLDEASLEDRIGKLTPKPANKADLERARSEVAKFNPEYREQLAKKAGESLWTDYETLRSLEANLAGWESQQALESALAGYLDTPTAKSRIDALVKTGIAREKQDSGLLADLTRLAKMTFPMELVGKSEILELIKENAPVPAPMGNSGTGNSGAGSSGGGTGVSSAVVETRVRRAESKAEKELETRVGQAETKAENDLKSAVAALESRFESRLRTYDERSARDIAALQSNQQKLAAVVEVLSDEVKKPRPLSEGQLAELQKNLEGTVQGTVVRELANRGIAATAPPDCKLPSGPTPDADRKKALFQFNQGCAHFYQGSTEQMTAAARHFSVATTLDPNEPTYRYFLGCALYSDGRPAEGLAQVRCAAELEKRQETGADVNQRLERIQYATRQWLERGRQPVLQGF